MSFEIGRTINGGAEWLCASSLVFGTLSNPVITALLITALALIVIYVMYKDELKGTGWRRGLKMGIWMVVGISALVFVHYYALERHLRKGHASQGVRDVMASIHHSAVAGSGYSVLGGDLSGGDDPRQSTDGEEVGPQHSQPPQLPRLRPDNVGGDVDPAAMDELGLQRVVLTSTPGPEIHA